MNVVYPVCCGVDVHKTFLVATIIKEGNKGPVYSKKRFSTFNCQLREFKKWLLDNGCKEVCMESTGKYWIPVYNILEDSVNVTVANPKWVRAIKGRKDDVKDSKWIGDLFRMGIVPGSFVPDKQIRILREFTRYLFKLTNMRSSERNRYQNAFTVCNISLDAVVTDMFGVFATNAIDYILNTPEDQFDDAYCLSLRTNRMKASDEDILNAIKEYHIEEPQKKRILLIKDHMGYIDSLIARLKSIINELVLPFEGEISLLTSIPGIDRTSAIYILAEIGTDMSKFNSSNTLTAWGGLAPTNNESAGKKKSSRISRAGVYLKPILVQIANAAIKDKSCPFYKIKYDRICARRGKLRAKIAIARMILSAIFYMLSRGEVFNPSDLDEVINPNNKKALNRKIKQSKKLLEEQGFTVTQNNTVSL